MLTRMTFLLGKKRQTLETIASMISFMANLGYSEAQDLTLFILLRNDAILNVPFYVLEDIAKMSIEEFISIITKTGANEFHTIKPETIESFQKSKDKIEQIVKIARS